MARIIFLSYASEDAGLVGQFKKHLSLLQQLGSVQVLDAYNIRAGDERKHEIERRLAIADCILLLVSSDFLDSEECYDQTKRALERHHQEQARVIPVIFRPIRYEGTPFEHLQALPTNAEAVTKWANADEAFCNVIEGVSQVTNLAPVFSVINLKAGQDIHAQDLPLTIRGRCSLKNIGPVWAVLRDSFRHFYLQNPPVEFQDDEEWIAQSILPGKGIRTVNFVLAGPEGEKVFQQKVDQWDFGAFDTLPADCMILCSVPIKRL